MASLLKLKTDIKKIKAAITSKATSSAIKTKLRGKLTSLENELDKLQPNKRKPKTTGPKNESALVRLAKKRRTNQGLSTSKSDIERDAIRPAKPAGRRTSANGNRYYEYRDNRVDNRQPPKKYRKLADGGMVSTQGFKKGDIVKHESTYKTFEVIDVENFVQSGFFNTTRNLLKLKDTQSGEIITANEARFDKVDGGYMAKGGKTQGYDDKKDESLGMTRGKLSLKDFVGNRKQKEHARRDDALFKERGKMADGGMMADGGQIKVGDKFGNYSVTLYKPIRYDDLGSSSDGIVKLVNQEDFDTLLIQYDGALRGGEWFISKGGKTYIGKNPKEVIEKLRINKMASGGMMAKGGKTKMPEWAVTITSENGDSYDWDGFSKSEDDALYKAEQEAGFDSVESSVVMITDENGEKIEYADGGYMAKGGELEMEEFYLYDENGKKYEFYKKEGDKYMFSSYKVPFGKALTIEKSDLQEKIKEGKYKVVANHADGGMMADGGQVQFKEGQKYFDKKEKMNLTIGSISDIPNVYNIIWQDGEYSIYSIKNIQFLIEKGIWKKLDLGQMADGGMMSRGGSVDYKLEVINQYSDEKLARIYSGLNDYDYSEILSEIKGDPEERKHIVSKIFKEVVERDNQMADGGSLDKFYEVKYTDSDGITSVVGKFIDETEAYTSANKLTETATNRGKFGTYFVEKKEGKFKDGGYMADGGSVAKGNYEMLLSQAKEVMHHAEELMEVAKPDMDIEAWVVAKAERATTDLSDITHYLDGLKMAMGGMVKNNAHKVNA